jgi:ferredoxin
MFCGPTCSRSPKKLHYIIADKCVGCGTCLDVCKPGAVLKA